MFPKITRFHFAPRNSATSCSGYFFSRVWGNPSATADSSDEPDTTEDNGATEVGLPVELAVGLSQQPRIT
jgi:hypothetical protein